MAAYRPPVKSNAGIRGNAKITVVKNKGLLVAMEEGNKTFKIPFGKCPKDIVYTSGYFNVRVKDDGSQLYNIHPKNGLYRGSIHEFVAGENEQPKIRTNYNVEFPYNYFIVLVKLTVSGMTAPVMPRAHFGPDQQEVKGKMREVLGITKPKSKYTGFLLNFLEVTGTWEKGALPYRDNPLPMLEKRMLQAAKEFNIMFRDGWVDDVYSIDEMPDEDAEEDDTMPSWDGDE